MHDPPPPSKALGLNRKRHQHRLSLCITCSEVEWTTKSIGDAGPGIADANLSITVELWNLRLDSQMFFCLEQTLCIYTYDPRN